VKILNEIGLELKSTRETSGVSLEEASTDLKIKTIILENIEDGNIGCFKDIFVLKEYIANYAKYLGLDAEKVINEFNEYLFEYTSRIPIKDIEKEIVKKEKKEVGEKIVSPYTIPPTRLNRLQKIVMIIVLSALILFVTIWSIKQIAINSPITTIAIETK